MLNRDSYVLWLAAAVAIVGYLSLCESPTLWHYDDWLKFASFALVWVSGKLATSPLRGELDGK
jgi:uncharacterized membrane protein (DUF2068 family)